MNEYSLEIREVLNVFLRKKWSGKRIQIGKFKECVDKMCWKDGQELWDGFKV